MKRIILFLLLLPMVKANDYTNNGYGQGVYGFGEEEPGTPILSSDGNVIGKVAQSKDGGCWSYANNDNTCYYLNNSQLEF